MENNNIYVPGKSRNHTGNKIYKSTTSPQKNN